MYHRVPVPPNVSYLPTVPVPTYHIYLLCDEIFPIYNKNLRYLRSSPLDVARLPDGDTALPTGPEAPHPVLFGPGVLPPKFLNFVINTGKVPVPT
jgi:hypothetical protein